METIPKILSELTSYNSSCRAQIFLEYHLIKYTVQRILLAVLIIACAVATMFIMIHAVPGDPANVMLGPRATPEIKEALGQSYISISLLQHNFFTFLEDSCRETLDLIYVQIAPF